MMRKTRIVCYFIGLVFFAWQPLNTFAAATATQWQSHAAIRGAAQNFMEAFVSNQHQGRSTVKLGQLDSRLRLKACGSPLDAFMPAGGRVMGNTTVGVRCRDDGGWNIYVSARVDVFGPVLIARQPEPFDPRLPARTSLLLALNHRQGALAQCLLELPALQLSIGLLKVRPEAAHVSVAEFCLELALEG